MQAVCGRGEDSEHQHGTFPFRVCLSVREEATYRRNPNEMQTQGPGSVPGSRLIGSVYGFSPDYGYSGSELEVSSRKRMHRFRRMPGQIRRAFEEAEHVIQCFCKGTDR